MKQCSNCKELKSKNKFTNQKNGTKDGLKAWCKKCANEYDKNYKKKYRLKNTAKIAKQQKVRQLRHEELNPNYNKNYYLDHQTEIKLNAKIYYQQNQKTIKEYSKDYAKNNRSKINKRRLEKYYNNPEFRLIRNLRSHFRLSFQRNKKTGSIVDMLGMTIPEFKIYLESKFENWMTWGNQGKYNGTLNFGWDIDHIKPLCLFDFTNIDEVKKAWHYTNLQPLCSKMNRDIKKDNYKTDQV